MCAVIIIISIGLAVVDILTRRNMREKARHIVVAEAIFDDFGKILVKHDGTIPMQIIETNADLGRVLSEIDPRQRTFHWLYQLTFNWHLVQPLVPRIVKAMRVNVKEEEDNFRGRFIEASVGLAQQLNLSVGDLGVLFDRVMTTGTRRVMADDESVHGISLKIEPSEGVLLFLCREIGGGRPSCVDYPEKPQDTPANFDTVEWWLERGYRLTDTRFFARTLADHMGTGRGEMDIFLSACKTYAKRGDRPVVQTQGTYLALFGVRPAPQSLDVMVYNFARHQIPAYRLPEMHYPISPSMRAWVRECGNMTMGELQTTANDAVHRAETSTTGSGSIQSQDDEQLYEFQAAIGVAIHSLITALKPWPQLLDLAKLSSEILELPSSNHDDEPPAQMIVLQCILPAPEARLTPVQSRASGVQAPFLNTGRADGDKPPQPFVYTPWSLFTKSQTCLMRGKAWGEMCRSMNAELARLYPPYDLATEVIEQEKGDGWASRASKLGLKADTHRRMASGETTWTSEDLGEAEKGFASQEMLTATPDTYSNITPGKKQPSQSEVKKGLSAMISQVTSTVAPGAADAEVQLKKRIPGAPIYQNIRLKADQWQARCIRDLEREDVHNMLDGYDWVTAARCG
ncbi:hypothetical protein BCR39DRAFT_510436 [Naematelia encephala]|uniref:Uncharacterized protein n=1 Tax=Naematelia encephala TaxID=71784 RepID=A0A1Y2BLA7_9TREE|nr:hypothetical protein BCR39DRAFT_510436 [Naematelia encephala]